MLFAVIKVSTMDQHPQHYLGTPKDAKSRAPSRNVELKVYVLVFYKIPR
jgi:hypothetical protein